MTGTKGKPSRSRRCIRDFQELNGMVAWVSGCQDPWCIPASCRSSSREALNVLLRTGYWGRLGVQRQIMLHLQLGKYNNEKVYNSTIYGFAQAVIEMQYLKNSDLAFPTQACSMQKSK